MKSTVKNVWAAILAMLAALCLAVGGVLFVQTESRLSANNNRVQAMGAMQSYDETYTLKDGDGKTKAGIWKNEVFSSENINKKILVILGENWDLDADANYAPKSFLEIPANYDITLDLNGKTLSRSLAAATNMGRILNVYANATFTLNDSVGTGVMSGGKVSGAGGGGILVSGTFIMNGGSIKNNECFASGGGINIMNGGVGIMNGGVIESNKANDTSGSGSDNGGGVQANGTFTMNGGVIRNNTATSGMGGGVCASSFLSGAGTFVMNGGEISGNTVRITAYGSGVTASAGGTFMLNGGTISGNNDPCGTAVAAYSGKNQSGVVKPSKFVMTGGTITANNYTLSTHGGGNIYITSVSNVQSTGIMTGGTISNHNVGPSTSGAIEVEGIFTIEGGLITGNRANSGSAIYVRGGGVANLNGGTITGNTSSLSQGVVTVHNNGALYIGGPVQIAGNTGGDVGISSAKKLNITDSIVGANIGILLTDTSRPSAGESKPGLKFTNGMAGNATNITPFFSNDSYYYVDNTGAGGSGEATLVKTTLSGNMYPRISFNWEYAIDGGALTAAAGNCIDLTYGKPLHK